MQKTIIHAIRQNEPFRAIFFVSQSSCQIKKERQKAIVYRGFGRSFLYPLLCTPSAILLLIG